LIAIIGEAANGLEALSLIEKLKPQLLFLGALIVFNVT